MHILLFINIDEKYMSHIESHTSDWRARCGYCSEVLTVYSCIAAGKRIVDETFEQLRALSL